MAAIQSYLDDIKMIDQCTKDIVNGCIRDAQKLFPNDNAYYNIPPLVIYWCILFYARESFDSLNSSQNYEFIGNTRIKKLRDCYETVYLTRVANKGKHKWTFQLYKFDSRKFTTIIGLWKTKFEAKPTNDLTSSSIKFYGLYVNDGNLTWNAYERASHWYNAPRCSQGDIIEMTLDLDKLQISYKVNEKDCGVAFKDIESMEYKACLCVHFKGDTIDLLNYAKS